MAKLKLTRCKPAPTRTKPGITAPNQSLRHQNMRWIELVRMRFARCQPAPAQTNNRKPVPNHDGRFLNKDRFACPRIFKRRHNTHGQTGLARCRPERLPHTNNLRTEHDVDSGTGAAIANCPKSILSVLKMKPIQTPVALKQLAPQTLQN